ncbi:hypothetical protein F5887DRAFT_1203881 [Amanita rubescens]|nr:hypothetical protein F5887DRAFT_1203881 [Amanita rubescens]
MDDNVILFPSPGEPPTPFLNIQECIKLRNQYAKASLQRPRDFPNDRLNNLNNLDESALTFTLVEGVYRVNDDADPVAKIPSIKDYYINLYRVIAINGDGPTKTVVGRRLKYLADKFETYLSEAERDELNDIKKGYRDLANIYKVDTHVHHTACMSLHRLNAFINEQIDKLDSEVWESPAEKQAVWHAAKVLKLLEETPAPELSPGSGHVSIDAMDMLAYRDSFHRFDNFNKKYSPAGVINDLGAYEGCEWRISVGGESPDDWKILADWIDTYKLHSSRVRWLIQVPRRSHPKKTFEEIVKNIFEPLFKATKDPSKHKKLHKFLEKVVGFDSVDDESKVEHRIGKTPPTPQQWKMEHVPPYSYWAYYMYANIATLNHWRKKRGFNTFVFRPHSGEAGDPEHVAAAFLTAQGIAHGITLRNSPVLQYLYYLKQIGIAMSPISNNALFLEYENNPLPNFFKVGLNVSLSTDDPLLFHFTHNALLEEYSVATHMFKFSQASLAELARNSVVQSGFEKEVKDGWMGTNWLNVNDINHTNVPTRRLDYRRVTLNDEMKYVGRAKAEEKVEVKRTAEAERRGKAKAKAEKNSKAEVERRKGAGRKWEAKEIAEVKRWLAAGPMSPRKRRLRRQQPCLKIYSLEECTHHAGFLVASLEANEKARQELKASTANFCTSEQFDAMFPPNIRYISKAWEEEISEKVWEDLGFRKCRSPPTSPAPFARRVKTALAFGTTPDSDGGMRNKAWIDVFFILRSATDRAWGERKRINELDFWQWGSEVERGMDIRCSEPSFRRI